jgi:hypothetical protein
MKRGREEREKVKVMTSRGIPGTFTDESQLLPLQFSSNTNYKQPIGGSNTSTLYKSQYQTKSKMNHSKSTE